jgi:hypothetical protein
LKLDFLKDIIEHGAQSFANRVKEDVRENAKLVAK